MLGQRPAGAVESPDQAGANAPVREPELPDVILQDFRRDCGMPHAFVIRVASSESGIQPQTVRWDRPWLIIGRGRECDLHLPHSEVSRRHAYLQVLHGVVYCLDLGSQTGTHWSHGSNASQSGRVELGEPVSIGPYSLRIEATEERLPGVPEATPEPEDPALPLMHLDFLNVGQEARALAGEAADHADREERALQGPAGG